MKKIVLSLLLLGTALGSLQAMDFNKFAKEDSQTLRKYLNTVNDPALLKEANDYFTNKGNLLGFKSSQPAYKRNRRSHGFSMLGQGFLGCGFSVGSILSAFICGDAIDNSRVGKLAVAGSLMFLCGNWAVNAFGNSLHHAKKSVFYGSSLDKRKKQNATLHAELKANPQYKNIVK